MAGAGSGKNLVATGVAVFAASMLVLAGLVQVINGFVGLSNDVVLARVGDYLYRWDADAWGVVHLLLGVLFVVAGFGIFAGKDWARMFAITLAVISAVTHVMWLPYYPVAALLVIALDVLVIWAVATFRVPTT